MKLFPVQVISMLWLIAGPLPAWAQWQQQAVPLKPGWNAVFLEVRPEPEDCDTLFAGLPIESVWDFNRPVDSPQFVQDPSTLIPGTPGWLTWFPPNHPLAGQGDLFILRDGRPYLIKVADSAQPVTWTVTGQPSLRRIVWQAGGMNFVGFRVGASGPSFQTWFAGEAGLAGQPVYSLEATGAWQPLPDLTAASPQAGRAYWVRCQLPAQRTATIEVDAGSREGLDFRAIVAEQSLRIRNSSSGARNVSVRVLPSAVPPAGQSPLAGPVPLEYRRTDFATTNLAWEPFLAPVSFTALPAGQEWNLRLGVRRAEAAPAVAGSQFQSLLEVADDLGARWLVPVRADPMSGTNSAGGRQPKSEGGGAVYHGLWVGEAVLKAVSQPAHPGDPALARPAGGEFPFRLIVHVDHTGAARLLRQVYLVRKPPIFEPDPEHPDLNRLVEPARTVVATDEALISGIIGPGEIVGRRISSVAFGFKDPVPLGGGAFGGGTLTASIALDYNDPLNPFKHRFHPDHNNLDERFEQTLPEGRESFTVTRDIALEFTPTDPSGLNPPGWGDTEMGGRYRETFTGLHRAAIHVGGTFRLTRAASSPALDQ